MGQSPFSDVVRKKYYFNIGMILLELYGLVILHLSNFSLAK